MKDTFNILKVESSLKKIGIRMKKPFSKKYKSFYDIVKELNEKYNAIQDIILYFKEPDEKNIKN